jgi:hypothetical protein
MSATYQDAMTEPDQRVSHGEWMRLSTYVRALFPEVGGDQARAIVTLAIDMHVAGMVPPTRHSSGALQEGSPADALTAIACAVYGVDEAFKRGIAC